MSAPAPAPVPTEHSPATPATNTSSSMATAQNSVTSEDTISSMADLKEKSPEVYNAMLQGIAMNICFEIKRQEEHLKRMQEEFRREAEA